VTSALKGKLQGGTCLIIIGTEGEPLMAVWSLLLQGGSEGPTLIKRTAQSAFAPS
jgi:hypothetical protein